MTGAAGAAGVLADLACAWTSIKLAAAGLSHVPEKDFRAAVNALEDLGDYACNTPARVITATRSLCRQWILADAATRAGPLGSAVDSAIKCAMAYLDETGAMPVPAPRLVHPRSRVAGDDA